MCDVRTQGWRLAEGPPDSRRDSREDPRAGPGEHQGVCLDLIPVPAPPTAPAAQPQTAADSPKTRHITIYGGWSTNPRPLVSCELGVSRSPETAPAASAWPCSPARGVRPRVGQPEEPRPAHLARPGALRPVAGCCRRRGHRRSRRSGSSPRAPGPRADLMPVRAPDGNTRCCHCRSPLAARQPKAARMYTACMPDAYRLPQGNSRGDPETPRSALQRPGITSGEGDYRHQRRLIFLGGTLGADTDV